MVEGFWDCPRAGCGVTNIMGLRYCPHCGYDSEAPPSKPAKAKKEGDASATD